MNGFGVSVSARRTASSCVRTVSFTVCIINLPQSANWIVQANKNGGRKKNQPKIKWKINRSVSTVGWNSIDFNRCQRQHSIQLQKLLSHIPSTPHATRTTTRRYVLYVFKMHQTRQNRKCWHKQMRFDTRHSASSFWREIFLGELILFCCAFRCTSMHPDDKNKDDDSSTSSSSRGK